MIDMEARAEITFTIKKQKITVDDIIDRTTAKTGGSCMAILPVKYLGRKVKVLVLKDD